MKRDLLSTKQAMQWCMLVFLYALAIYLRYTLFDIHTSDYDGYFSRWYDFIQSHGGFAALKYNFSNYNVSYLYLLTLGTYLPLPKVITIKGIPVCFDFVMAYFIYLIVRLKYQQSFLLPTIASLAVLFTPTVFLMSGLWGQFESIYASLCVGSLYFVLRKRPEWACMLFGLALSFKLQAFFFFPLLFILLITRDIPKRYMLIIPVVYVITVLPACLMGRNFMDALTIYRSWADDPVHSLTNNAPNLFQWLPADPYDTWKQVGIILALSAVGMLSLVILASRSRMTREIMLKLALIFVLLIPFFLPDMHERDYYLADILSLIYAFYFPKKYYIAIIVQICSLISYSPYLAGSAVIDLKYITFLVVGVIMLTMMDLVHTPFSVDDVPVEPIAGSWQDVIVLFLLGGLLLYGTFTDYPGDPGLYHCYAVAFWQGGGSCGFVQTNEIVHALQQWRLPAGFIQWVTAQPPNLPYHGLPNEYPLLALLPFSVGLLTLSSQYQTVFGLEMLVFVGGIYFVLRFWQSRRAALAFSLYLLVGGWMTAAGRFDLVPAALTLFAVICAGHKRWNWAFALLALAMLCKLYPAILLIPFFLALQQEIQGKWYVWCRWQPIGVFVGICILVGGVSLSLNVAGTLAPLGYFFVRPVEWESLPGSLFWIASVLWKTPLAYVGGFGSLNVESPLSSRMTLLMDILQVVGLLATWWLQQRRRIDLAMACLLTLLIVMVTGKVFSIQYLIWVIPLAAYVGQSNRRWLLFWTLMGFLTSWRLTVLLVSWVAPHLTFQSMYGTPLFYTPLYTLRNFLLLGFIVSTLISRSLLFRPKNRDDGSLEKNHSHQGVPVEETYELAHHAFLYHDPKNLFAIMRMYLAQRIAHLQAIGGNSMHRSHTLMTSFLAAHKNFLEFVIFFIVYLPWSFLQLKLKLGTTPNYLNGILEQDHHLLLLFQYTNNEQSRLLQWLVPEAFIHLFHLSIVQAYMLQRLIFIFLAFLCFHFYLRKWFTVGESFAGVAAMAAIMPLTYLEDLQESSCLLLLTFLLGLWAIRSHKTFIFIIVLSIGLLNNETMAILPLAYFFYEYRSLSFRDLRPLLGKMVVVALPIFFILLPIRYITRNSPHLGGGIYNLPTNLQKMHSDLSTMNIFDVYHLRNLYIFPIFGILWAFAFIPFQGKPLFLKRVTYIIPFFVIIHLLTGEISEVRQMLPLAFIIIPSFLFYWKTLSSQKRNLVKADIQEKSSSEREREKSSSQREREDVEPRSSSFWLLVPCVLLLASVISFLLEKSFFSEAKSGESRHSRKEFFGRRARRS